MRRLVGEGALRVGRSFVEKRGKAGRNGGCSIEESGGSIGEIEQRCAVVGAEVRSCAAVGWLVRRLVGEDAQLWGRGCAVVGAWAWLCVSVGALLWRQRVVGREQLYRREWRLYRRESSEGALIPGAEVR